MPYYHVWFATKNRKWLLQGDVGDAARRLLREVANEKGLRLIESEAVVDHVHLLIEAENKASISWQLNLLKGISSRRLNLLFPDVRMDAQTLNFWQAGFGSKVVPDGAIEATRHYIRTQWERLESFDKPNRLKT